MNKLKDYKSATLKEAIKLLDENGNGFLPVVDKNDILLGIITDGDLRRAILRDETDLELIINFKPTVAFDSTQVDIIKQSLRNLHRRHMPVIDNEGKLVNVVGLTEFEVKYKDNIVVIMAGGLGTRLKELTSDTPKPMLRVGNKPILHIIIEQFKSQGFGRFVLCVNYRAEIFEKYFGNGYKFNVDINYTKEKTRMGTGGALRLLKITNDHPFIVVNGDVLTSLNYDAVLHSHKKSGCIVTICIKEYSTELPYGCVDIDPETKRLIKISEKPSMNCTINTGVYILNPDALEYLPGESYFDMTDFMEELIRQGQNINTFKNDEYWIDIGNYNDYMKGNSDYGKIEGN